MTHSRKIFAVMERCTFSGVMYGLYCSVTIVAPAAKRKLWR